MKRGLFLFIVLIFTANAFAQGSSHVKILYPNGLEYFIPNQAVKVTWDGIPITDTVSIEFSTNNGESWSLITDIGTNGEYNWTTPNIQSTSCIIQITEKKQEIVPSWVKTAGGTSTDMSRHIAIDSKNSVYIAGTFSEGVYFDTIYLRALPLENIFLAKYNPDGTVSWVKNISGPRIHHIGGIAIDLYGNILIVGIFSDSIHFGSISLDCIGDYNYFIAKYAPNGDVMWAKNYRGAAYQDDYIVSIDSIGNIYTAGSFFDTLVIDNISIPNTGYSDVYIAKYTNDGEVIWVRQIGGKGEQIVQSISSDRAGNSYITGVLTDTCYFGNKILIIPPLNSACYVAKYDTDGNVSWIKTPIGADTIVDDIGWDISTDREGNSYVAVEFYWHDYILKYSANGDEVWRRSVGNIDWPILTIDNANDVYLTGEFSSPTNIGDDSLISNGDFDICLAKLSNSGDYLWAINSGEENDDIGSDVAIDTVGNIYVTGFFRDSTFIGNNLISAGRDDIYLWKIGASLLKSDITDDVFSIIPLSNLVYIPDDSAAPGEHKGIPILLGGSVTKNYSKLGAVKFKADIEFNSSLLAPDGVILPSVIDKGRRTLTIEASWDGSSDTLTMIPFIAALGDAERTTMNIPKFEWLDGFGAPLTLDVETKSGMFKINDICYEGGARLIITGGQFSLSEPIPNPSASFTTIRYDLIEEGQTELVITDVIGRKVRTLFSGEAKPGSYSVRVNTDQLATGKYFYTLRTPTLHAMKMMLVEH